MTLTSKTVSYKQPSEKLRMGIDFGNILQTSETISSPTAEVSPSTGLSVHTLAVTGDVIAFWAESGVHGTDYRIEIQVDSDSGEELESDAILRVRDR